jgi:hypothetical protein
MQSERMPGTWTAVLWQFYVALSSADKCMEIGNRCVSQACALVWCLNQVVRNVWSLNTSQLESLDGHLMCAYNEMRVSM